MKDAFFMPVKDLLHAERFEVPPPFEHPVNENTREFTPFESITPHGVQIHGMFDGNNFVSKDGKLFFIPAHTREEKNIGPGMHCVLTITRCGAFFIHLAENHGCPPPHKALDGQSKPVGSRRP